MAQWPRSSETGLRWGQDGGVRCEWQNEKGKQCEQEATWFAVSLGGARYPRCYNHGFPAVLLVLEPDGPMCKPISELPEWLSAQKVMRYVTGRPNYVLAAQEGMRKARESK